MKESFLHFSIRMISIIISSIIVIYFFNKVNGKRSLKKAVVIGAIYGIYGYSAYFIFPDKWLIPLNVGVLMIPIMDAILFRNAFLYSLVMWVAYFIYMVVLSGLVEAVNITLAIPRAIQSSTYYLAGVNIALLLIMIGVFSKTAPIMAWVYKSITGKLERIIWVIIINLSVVGVLWGATVRFKALEFKEQAFLVNPSMSIYMTAVLVELTVLLISLLYLDRYAKNKEKKKAIYHKKLDK